LFVFINYFLGLGIQYYLKKPKQKLVFWIGIIVNVGILAFFKYINFIFENLNYLLSWLPESSSIPYLSLIIPVGISYYTFQALGYLIRINRGVEKPERNIGKFAIYLLFFPKFLSGPVERSNHFFPQINSEIAFDGNNVSIGLRLFLWGLFKKVVIANNLSGPVFMVYDNLHDYSGFSLIVVLFLQTIFLYADFSGYTDMALGSAKILGIDIIDNFNRPFLSKSITEFWRRWHISLSSWCNDFIFTPFIVKYRKMGNKAAIIGVFLTFFVIGIWHGAKWTYVVLGLLQGIAISYEFYTKRKRKQISARLPKRMVNFISIVLTFTFFSFSLVFFNSESIKEAWYFIANIFSTHGLASLELNMMIPDRVGFLIGVGGFLIVFIVEVIVEGGLDLLALFLKQPRYLRWIGYYIMVFLVYAFSTSKEAFVYLQF
jgi:D-alanyl-lipoteichoic acid acyltransferase DltB (MBOAT superfamily)